MIRCTIPMSAVVALLFATAVGAEPKAATYVIQFVGENGKPIPDARFYLYEKAEGRFQKALYRGYGLGDAAEITIQSLPDEFTIGVASHEHFYEQFWDGKGRTLKPLFPCYEPVNLSPGRNVIRVEQTGGVSITFAHVDQEIQNQRENSPVLPYYYRSAKGEYVLCGGIGIWPAVGKPILIHGLPPGDYKFELKPNYDSNDVFWVVSDIAIRKRNVTEIKNVGAFTVR